jgi:hypothetical protein
MEKGIKKNIYAVDLAGLKCKAFDLGDQCPTNR